MAYEVIYNVTSLLYTFVIALIITTIILKWFRERKYPPGPIGVPVFGYIFFLGKRPHLKLRDLSRKYGDVFSLYLGPQLNICINDYAVAKDLLCNPNLLIRPEHLSTFLTGRGGIAGMNGDEWQEQRRFTFYTMRNLGLGKGLWETMIQESMAEFTEELKNLKGQPKNLEDILGSFHASNIMSLLLGRPLYKEKDDEEIRIIHESTKEFMKYLGQVSMFVLFPWLRKFIEVFRLAGYDKFLRLLRKFEDIFKKEVERRLKSKDSLEKDDFISCFYREMMKREKSTDKHTFTMENLLGNLIVLFISSHDTTMATISWLLIYMAAYPDIQKRVHDEIDSVVGRDGVIYFDDKAKFPYTMATIFEMLRHASIAPLTPPRIVPEDMTINDYHIPKGSYILINIWFIMHDPRYFKDPMEFNPERFCTEKDKVVKSLDGFIPFSVAKELLNNPRLLHRPIEFSSFLTGGGGIAGMNGEEWQEQRRFTFYTMRNLGLGKGLWETMIQDSMAEFTEELKSLKGKPKNLDVVLGSFHASNIMSLLLGRHLDKQKDAEEINIIYETTKAFMKYFGQVSMFALFPWLKKILEIFGIGGYDKFMAHLRKFEDIFKKEVEKRLKSPESLERDDYISCFFKEMKKRETTMENHTFTMENLLGNLIVLFISSHDSTLASISWLLLYMIAYPDIQKRVHDEIDSVVGRDGVIYFEDKAKLPYTMATVFELLRHASIASLSPPRTILEDMTIKDYEVPKGSFLVVNLGLVMHDPKYFKEPMEFKPERFLAENGKVVKSLEGFIPFSVGKRNCPGEGIAIMTAFLYFASFMQKFQITVPPGKKVDLEPISGIANVPKPQEICFLER